MVTPARNIELGWGRLKTSQDVDVSGVLPTGALTPVGNKLVPASGNYFSTPKTCGVPKVGSELSKLIVHLEYTLLGNTNASRVGTRTVFK